MSGGPANASIAGDGFRWYEWVEEGKEPVRVLSVTSVRKLCGESYQLVAWQLANLANAATGMTKRVVIGPRGGRSEKYVRDGWDLEDPDSLPEFVRRVRDARTQADLDAARAWLMGAADAPRDTAAVRGTIVHEAIEFGATLDRVDEDYIAAAVERLSERDRKKVKTKGGITDDDVAFVRQCVAQYWDLRAKVPFVILAKEPQVWNLTAGYAGSADVLLWFLGEWIEVEVGDDENGEPVHEWAFEPIEGIGPAELRQLQSRATKADITQADIAQIGGTVVLGDWKTSKGVYTDQIVQVTAYQAAEFVGSAGVRDERLTDILAAVSNAAIIHIRPDGWTVHFTEFRADVLRAFLGSVAFARFLAMHKEPDDLFTHDVSGVADQAEETEAA